MPVAECPLLEAIRPVVFTVRVALPAPLSGMLNEDGVTVQAGDEADAGWTEQVRLTVSIKPFRVPIVIAATPWLPTETTPNDVGATVMVKSGWGGGALLDRKV